MKQNPYVIYTDAYPHGKCYRIFSNPVNISDLWRYEDTTHLFLYLNIPFCQQRCGYCNLFSKISNATDLVDSYIESMENQARSIVNMFNYLKLPYNFDHIAIGGGSLSVLNPDQLQKTLDVVEKLLQTPLNVSDLSIELQPGCTEEFLDALLERNTYRISFGAQSFFEKDLKRLQLFSSLEQIHDSLELISSMSFPRLNIDLIYGIEDQTEKDFLNSIDQAIKYEPDEFNLYPLYIRPETTLEESSLKNNPEQLNLYFNGQERLIDAGYFQDSMRRFVIKPSMRENTSVDSQEYSDISDDTIGIGWGSQSYTKKVHYSEPYAISQAEIDQIILNYTNKNQSDFANISYGIELSEEDKRRRFILKSLLKVKGLDIDSYRREFNENPQIDFPELLKLLDNDLAHKNGSFIILTEYGLALSDIIGPWLYSQNVIDLIEDFNLN
jgi:oxygen-independent coproporphyrinogen-3 oxidase